MSDHVPHVLFKDLHAHWCLQGASLVCSLTSPAWCLSRSVTTILCRVLKCPDRVVFLLGMQAAGLGERSGFAEPASAAHEALMPGNATDWDADEDVSDDEGGAPEALCMPPHYTAAMAEQCAPRLARFRRLCGQGMCHKFWSV